MVDWEVKYEHGILQFFGKQIIVDGFRYTKDVKLLSSEERLKVAAELANMKTEWLIDKLEAFKELPSCLELTILELKKRGIIASLKK